MSNNADKLMVVCDALFDLKESKQDIDATLQQLITARDTLAAVLNDPHPDDNDETTKRLKAGYDNLVASIAALESAKVK